VILPFSEWQNILNDIYVEGIPYETNTGKKQIQSFLGTLLISKPRLGNVYNVLNFRYPNL